MKTDYELIKLCIIGEKEYFAELVDRYKNLVYSIIMRQTNNRDEAADIAQEVFIKVYRNLASYSPEYKFSTWLMRITTNQIIDTSRRKKQDTVSYEEYTESGGTLPDTAPSPEAEVLRRDQAERINKLVAELPEKYKIPVLLYHQQGLSYQEIAEKMDEPLSKIKNRIFRGRKMLKAIFANSGGV